MSDTAYIALLRRINVGGHAVTMERLRSLFSDLGLSRVGSYIQSGNIFFESSEPDRRALRSAIEHKLRATLGYEVATCLRTVSELEDLLARDPFRGLVTTPDTRHAVTFLAEPAAVELAVPYRTPDDAYEVVSSTLTEVFVVWHLREGRPGNSYGLIEKQLQTPATTRFWHTTAKILAASKVSRT